MPICGEKATMANQLSITTSCREQAGPVARAGGSGADRFFGAHMIRALPGDQGSLCPTQRSELRSDCPLFGFRMT